MKYNHRKYNHLVLQNYIYIALFESKYAVYYAERMAASIENILEVLQFVFLRDIQEEEYVKYLHEIVLIGTHVALKSATLSKKPTNYSFIKEKLSEAKISYKNKNHINTIPQYENLLKLLTDAISQDESGKNLKLVNDKTTAVNMIYFKKEYDMLFESIETNEKVYSAIDTIENSKFPDDSTSCVLSRNTAIHEIHQGFTHLARHVNSGYSDGKEMERFKSHVRRAALDLLKLSIESMRNYFTKTKQADLCNEMLLEFSTIKNQEVSNVVSTSMPDFKFRYTSLINKFIDFIK